MKHLLDLYGGPEKLGEVADFVYFRVKECIRSYKSKEETAEFIYDTFQIPRRLTRSAWNVLEKRDPNYFSSYKTLCENIRNASITAVAQTTSSNVEIETYKSDEGLEEASTSHTEQDNRLSKARKAKEQRKQPPEVPQQAAVLSKTQRRSEARKKAKEMKRQQQQAPVTETDPIDETSEVPKEAASTSVSGDAPDTVKNVSGKARRRYNAHQKRKENKQQLRASQQHQQAPEQAHKLQSNVDGKPRTDTKDFKRQSSWDWEQVRDGYEQAEILQDLNQQVQQEMQRMDIPGNEGSDNSSEDALSD